MNIGKTKVDYKKILWAVGLGVITYAFLSVYNTMILTGSFNTSINNLLDFGIFALALCLAFSVMFYLLLYRSEWVFKYRYVIALILFIICVIVGINGSSIECMYGYLDGNLATNVVLGTSRPIRFDEWNVLTPLVMSQYYGSNPFSYFSSIVRGTLTDVFIEYGTPVRSLIMVFRPFYIGYLFLPFANGLAFFWSGRIIALFMTSFEFGRLISKDNKRLALVYAFLITFAPAVQWWFAINGFVEMLIFAQLSILMLKMYMTTNKYWIRCINAAVVVICAGGYILTMYPSWMVPIAYIIVAVSIWVIIDNWKMAKYGKRDIFILLAMIIVLAVGLGYVFVNSQDTIKLLMNTVYPGNRFETGGGLFNSFFTYINNVWFAIFGNSPVSNVCEESGFLSLFPLGIVLYIIYIIKEKKQDTLATILTILVVFFGIWEVFGFPSIVAKITLMSYSQAGRSIVVFDLVNVILLVRTVHLVHFIKINNAVKVSIGVAIALVTEFIAYRVNPEWLSYYSIWFFNVVIMLFAIGAFLLINHKSYWIRRISCVYLCLLAFLMGGLVNPVRIGSSDPGELEELGAVKEIVESDPYAVWVCEVGFPVSDMLLTVGAPTLNSVNVYPNLDIWSIIDTTGEYEEIYNRYAHIKVDVTSDESLAGQFELVQSDVFSVKLTVEQLKELGVKYIFTRDTEELNGVELVRQVGSTYIYEIL